MFEFSMLQENAYLFKNSFNEIFEMLQLHCDLFWKNLHFGPIQNSESSFSLITSISTKLSYHYVEYLLALVISTTFQTNIAQAVFKSQRIYVIQFIGKYLTNHTLFCSLLRTGCGCQSFFAITSQWYISLLSVKWSEKMSQKC